MFKWILFIFLAMSLSACAPLLPSQNNTAQETDTSPSSKKYKELSVYKVKGKSYHTLKTSKNYHEQGVASWYGREFHRQRTSSGERFNMLAMTAAHKTLPIHTYVEVTNLKNHRKVVVKINDRGPFEHNRLIDLSYVAAKKLGIVGHGTALVDVKAVDLDPKTRKTVLARK